MVPTVGSQVPVPLQPPVQLGVLELHPVKPYPLSAVATGAAFAPDVPLSFVPQAPVQLAVAAAVVVDPTFTLPPAPAFTVSVHRDAKLAVTDTVRVLALVGTTQDPVPRQLALDQPVNW